MKYTGYRFDISPKWGEYQQTYRYVFPLISIWADEKRINVVGVNIGWWKWSILIMFKINEKKLDNQSNLI